MVLTFMDISATIDVAILDTTCGGERMKISATRIDTILAERGMTKAALADSCGVSRQNISTIIRRGTCEPKTAGKLAAGLGVAVSEIVET